MAGDYPTHDPEETADEVPRNATGSTADFTERSLPPGANAPGASAGPHGESIPDQIDRYKIENVLGFGGFGVVYRATQSEPVKRTVALKVIKRGMDSDAIVTRFRAERQALAVMNHPGVAKIFDAGRTESGQPWFAMEFVPGRPLNEFCDIQKLDLAQRAQLMIKVCEAIQHAHIKGVVHRDLKPGNILVTEHGSEITPRVIDFGIAKAIEQDVDSDPESDSVTLAGQMLGTPEYMAPEQTGIADADIDGRADVYALGVILYVLMCGDLPIPSEDLREALKKGGIAAVQTLVQEQEPLRPSTRYRRAMLQDPKRAQAIAHARRSEPAKLRRRLENDLDWIALRCLEKDRERRYDSPTALAEDLRRHLRHEPVSAGPPTASYVARKFIRRNRPLVIGTSAVLLVLVAGLVASLILLARALEAEQDARATIGALVELPTADDPNIVGSSATIGELNRRLIEKIESNELAQRPRDRALLLSRISSSSYNRGEYEAALRYADMVLELEGDKTVNPSHIADARKTRDLATLALGQSLAIANETSGSAAATPRDHMRRGFVSFDLGDYDRAAWHLQSTIDGTKTNLTANWDEYVSASEWLARLLADQGHAEAADRWLEESFLAHQQYSDPDAIEEAQWDASTELARGALARSRGDFESAHKHLLEAERIYSDLHAGQPNRMVTLSRFELETAEIDQRVRVDDPDVDLLARFPEQGRMEFILLRNRARAFQRLGDLDRCLQLLELAIVVEAETAAPERQPGHTLRVRARILAEQGDLEGAHADLERAFDAHSASAIGADTRAELLLELAAIAALSGDDQEARAFARRAVAQREKQLPPSAWPTEVAKAYVALFAPGEEDRVETILESLDKVGDPAAPAAARIRALRASLRSL